jgi:sulfide:quinone oxidoreductase
VRLDTDIHFHTSVGNLFPNCAKFASALKPIAEEKNIDVHYTSLLTKIDKDNRVATFKNTSNEEVSEVEFDLLHVPPPQSAPKFIRESPLAAANGWLAVDHSTLQHKNWSNIYGLGDVCDLPTAKTAAAIFSQTPVVVHNILRDIGAHESKVASYDGYSSCPLFVGDKKLMLIEFKYGGESKETFSTSQDKPSRLAFHLKKDILPRAYYNYMPQGEWYGANWFKPTFE